MIAKGAPYSPIGHVSTLWIGAALLIPTFAILAFIALQPWIPVAYLVRDPLVVAMQAAECCSFYYGALSNLGVLLWNATGTICLTLALQVWLAGARRSMVAFFLTGGLFSIWLGLDDLFLLHDGVLPALGVGWARLAIHPSGRQFRRKHSARHRGD